MELQKRMISFWLRLDQIIRWPESEICDSILRRADAFAESGATAAVIFGAHFRWDYLPIFHLLHDQLCFLAETMHERGIGLIDHHSATLTRVFPTMKRRAEMWRVNNFHFSPDPEASADWTFHGRKMREWRMLDVFSGEAVFLENYCATEFCFNNPEFQESYREYLTRLLKDCPLDGLMCDDALYYPGFMACGCPHCLNKFGVSTLPSAANTGFWGNWQSSGFRDWIAFRYQSVADFNHLVRSMLPQSSDFFYSNCCADSTSANCNGTGMDYNRMAEASSVVELEMCSNLPDPVSGRINDQIPRQLYHIAVADKHNRDCFGLGYGFSEPSAQAVWFFNSFLGIGTWFSSQKTRLGLPEKILATLPDDSEPPSRVFRFEKQHKTLFGELHHLTENALYYSNATRCNYGGDARDYSKDYDAACRALFEDGADPDVILDIPPPSAQYKTLYIPSAACFGTKERVALDIWLKAGKRVVASGPFAIFDEKGNPDRWFSEINVEPLVRTPLIPIRVFRQDIEPARCHYEKKCKELRPGLLWYPERMAEQPAVENKCGWYVRYYSSKEGLLQIHCLAKHYTVQLNEDLEKQRTCCGGYRIVDSIRAIWTELPVFASLVAEKVFDLYLPPDKCVRTIENLSQLKIPSGVSFFLLKEHHVNGDALPK